LVGFATSNSNRVREPTLSWNQFHSHAKVNELAC
jgi:hypothetical protein